MAHIPRLFIDSALSEGAIVELSSSQIQYLTKVMRLKEGAEVRVFNGRDGEWTTQLNGMGKAAVLRAERQTRPQTYPPELTLLFAPIKRTRTEMIIEKATELGVSRIMPVITEYTQFPKIRLERFQSIIEEAAEQTERLNLPDLAAPQKLTDALGGLHDYMPVFFADESSEARPMLEQIRAHQSPSGAILIGPEGGFSPAERTHLRIQKNVVPITLGPRILRAETAVVSALTLWQSEVGDWAKPPYVPKTD